MSKGLFYILFLTLACICSTTLIYYLIPLFGEKCDHEFDLEYGPYRMDFKKYQFDYLSQHIIHLMCKNCGKVEIIKLK